MDQPPTKKSGWKRIVQGLGLGSIALGIAGAILKSWATYYFGAPVTSRPVDPPALVQAAAAEPAPRTIENLLQRSPVSLMHWQQLVEQSRGTQVERERQFREYLGREVVWEGYFDEVNRNQHSATPERAYVLILHESYAALNSQSLLGPPSIRCYLPESAAPELEQLRRGEWIVVRGLPGDPLMSGSLLCTDLEPCEILAHGRVRQVQLAVPETGAVVR